MISEQAKHAVDSIFTKAAKANLTVNPEDSIEISRVTDTRLGDLPGKDIVVLTISSYLFRLLTIFHVTPDKATAGYFNKSDSNREFHEVFNEHGNLCVGAMNRDLGNHFVHLGMSTPYKLQSNSAPFISELKPGYVSHHRIGINADISLHATLCLCAYRPLDFRIDPNQVEEEFGELELF
jgi:hypothetical protein